VLIYANNKAGRAVDLQVQGF